MHTVSYEVVATRNDAVNRFSRPSQVEADALAAELEKENYVITINGVRFLNSAGPDELYLHQSLAQCPLCITHQGCARCKDQKGEFYSVKPTHYHARVIEGTRGHEGMLDILCYDCHRKDRFEVYGPTYGESPEAA